VTARSKTIAAGDLTRVLNAMKAKFNLPGGATNQQIFDAFADWIFDQLKNATLLHERTTASDTAVVGVADIPLT
jgi:microcystin degradation protein MlrC